MRRQWLVLSLALACGASSLSGARAVTLDAVRRPAAGCAGAASPAAAAQVLLHPRAEVVGVERIGGLPSALVSVPIVVGGARHRLVRTAPAVWCDALAGFNAVASGDDVTVASSFASVAAARYFDGVTVRAARAVAPGRVELETHALTNGVVATWNVAVDPAGVRHASWRATAFAVEPFEPQLYGPTALPGATMEYRRDGAGGLSAVSDPFAAADAVGPGVESSVVEMPDGFTIVVSRGHAPYAYPEARTGVWDVDVLGVAVRATRHNYEDFLSWGLRGSWVGPGNVFIDGGLAPFCGACVLPSPAFNVHMLSAFPTYAELLGYTYPDPELFFSTVVGHEVFHNFQSANGSTYFPSAFVEGMARFQETLHDYSHVSHQPGSIIYADGSSGCNGYVEYMAYSLSDHVYDACYFWMSVFVDHGPDVIRNLVEADGMTVSLEEAIQQATGVPLETTMSRFATRALTRTDLVWGPITGSGPQLDWAAHLEPWSPGALTQVSTSVGPAAAVGGRITASTPVEVSASGPTRFTVVRRSGAASSTDEVVSGATVAGPGPGEDVWVVAATGASPSSLTISVAAAIPPETSGLEWDEFRTFHYVSRLLPTQSAAAVTSANLSSLTFDLHAEAADQAVSPLAATAVADASLDGTARLSAGDYAFVAEVEFDDFDLRDQGGLGGVSRAYSRASVDAFVWCEDSYCSAYDSYYNYSDYGYDPVDAVTLVALLHVDRAQDVQVGLSPSVSASSAGGSAVADLGGRVVDARFVRIT